MFFKLIIASIILLIFILTVSLMFTGFYRMSQYYARFKLVRMSRVKISDIYPKLKTGDLFYFTASTNSGTNSMLMQSFFSHVAMVIREGDLVYLSETQAGVELQPTPHQRPSPDPVNNQYMKMGRHAYITPLLTKLKYYTGTFYVSQLMRPLEPDVEELIKQEAERLYVEKYPYPSLVQSFFSILFGLKSKSRHCFQHVAYLLNLARLTQIEDSFIDICEKIYTIQGEPLLDVNYYMPIYQVLYDLDCTL